MQELRILVGRHYGWDGKHETSIILDNILPILRNKFKVKITWFFYLPERMNNSRPHNLDEDFVDIHDFDNALEVLKKVKPDLVFDNEFPSLIDLAIDTAAKYLQIPVVSRMNASTEFKISRKELLTTFIPSFFQGSMPFEENQKKQFMRRGRFFLYKYWFLLKTLRATHMNLAKTLKHFFIVLNWHMSYKVPYIDSRFANTLHFLESENLVEKCLKAGYERSSLIITGNPIYDETFKKYASFKPEIKKEKIRVLFAPLQNYESGVWTKKQRDFAITEIVKNISNRNDFSLFVKLHPSSQVYSEYESIIHKINPSVPIYQKETIIDFIDKSDVVISFVPISSVAIYTLIAHKPLILCNFFGYEKDFFLRRNLGVECKYPSDINSLIERSIKSNFIPDDRVDNFIREFLYKPDGLASERVCEAIAELVKKIGD